MDNQPDNQNKLITDKIIDLLDGAEGFYDDWSIDIESHKKVAADINKNVEERLEAYEDIFESEVCRNVWIYC